MQKYLIIIVGFLIVAAIAFVVWLTSRPNLTIETTPPDSLVFVDDSQKPEPQNTFRLKKGLHKIAISREGYIPESFSVNLAKNMTFKITLYKNSLSSFSKTQDLGNFASPVLTGQGLFSVNSQTNTLVGITNNQALNINLPTGVNIGNLVFSQQKILIQSKIDYGSPGSSIPKYYLYDIPTKSLAQIDLSSFDPVTSVGFGPDGQSLLVAGKYQQQGNLVSLFDYNYQNNKSTLLAGSVSGGLFLPLLENKVLIIRTQDQENSDSAQILDTTTKSLTPFVEAPDFIKYPTPNSQKPLLAYLGTGGLVIRNYINNEIKKPLPNPPVNFTAAWIDESNILVADTQKNTVIKINIDNNSVSPELKLPFLPGKTLVSIISLKNQIAYIYLDIKTNTITIAYSNTF